MDSFYHFKSSHIIIIYLYYIFISINEAFSQTFIDMKKLSIRDNYFVVLDSGLYLYNFNTLNCSLIHEFNNIEYKNSDNNILINELYYSYKAYIFCLVNEYLFIFNEKTFTLLNYKINEISLFTNNFYNILPYNIQNNNISFIIVFNNASTNLFFYLYNFNLNEGINEPKIITFNNMNNENKMIKCEINYYSTFITCFYYSKNSTHNYLSSKTFLIKNKNINEGKLNLYDNGLFGIINIIKQIKLAKDYNDNLFVCFLSENMPICLIINNNNYEIKEINCTQENNWGSEYKVFYFNKTNDFMLISRKSLDTTLFNNGNDELKKCKAFFLPKQKKEYSIIYNNNYMVINALNFSDYLQCINISLLKNNIQKEYIDKSKDLITSSENKEELI